MVEIKTAGEIQAMRAAGQVVARILAAVQDQAKAGMRTSELDEIARDVLAAARDVLREDRAVTLDVVFPHEPATFAAPGFSGSSRSPAWSTSIRGPQTPSGWPITRSHTST